MWWLAWVQYKPHHLICINTTPLGALQTTLWRAVTGEVLPGGIQFTSSKRRDDVSITETVFAIVCVVVGLWIIGAVVAEWISDSKLRRDMRHAGANGDEIEAMFRKIKIGRNTRRRR